jgi:hypothetical protein
VRVFVTTSDWYNPIIPAFAYLFNRYWSHEQEVTILGYTPANFSLPSNFGFHSLGDPREFGNNVPEWSTGRRGRHFGELYPTPQWTDSLRRWIDDLPDRQFILLQIDYFVHKPVKIDLIKKLERYLERENVSKIDLSTDRYHSPHHHYDLQGEIEIIVSDQQAQYRSSLQAAIWKRDYLAAMLKPGRSPWDFERYGMYEHMNDGKLILGVADANDGPVPYLNVYGDGRVNWRQLRKMNPAVLSELQTRGWLGPHWNGWTEPL